MNINWSKQLLEELSDCNQMLILIEMIIKESDRCLLAI